MPKPPKTLEIDADLLARIAAALERLAPPALAAAAPAEGDAFVWEPGHGGLLAVPEVAHLPLGLLKGVDAARDTLVQNTTPLRRRPARQQCAAVGRARHGQELAGEGGACRGERDAQRRPRAWRWSKSIAKRSRACPRCCEPCAAPSGASFSIATIFPSTRTTPATNRSRRRSKAASKAGRRTCSSMRRPTAAISCRAT